MRTKAENRDATILPDGQSLASPDRGGPLSIGQLAALLVSDLGVRLWSEQQVAKGKAHSAGRKDR